MQPKKFYIAGVQFHQLKSCIKSLKEGDNLSLVPEPSNKYDPNAVRIEFNDADESYMTGFVPKKFSSEVAAAITVGKQLECVITQLNPSAKTWEMCEVEIKEVS